MRIPSYRATVLFLKYCLVIDICFFVIYGGCNWLTHQRADHFALFFDWELSIPFVPSMIWGYSSMFALFLFPLFQLDEGDMRYLGRQILLALPIAGISFLLLPAKAGFPRLEYVPGYDTVYQFIYTIDYPHNLVPSLHITFSTLIIAALMEVAVPIWQRIYGIWLAVISVSVVLVHQHHVADVASGYLLALACRRCLQRPTRSLYSG